MRHGLALALLIATVAPAAAEPDRERASAAFAAGHDRYAAGDYIGAAHAFEEAYRFDPDPAYLFNIAQAFRLGGGCAEASRYYRKFLSELPAAPNRDDVDGYLQETDACVVKQAASKPPLLAPQPPPPSPRVTRGDVRLRLAGLATGFVGAVSLGVGVAFHRKVRQDQRDADGLCVEDPCAWDGTVDAQQDKLDSQGSRHSAIAITAYTAGGIALLGGAALYFVGTRVERRVAIAPARGGAVATFGLAF